MGGVRLRRAGDMLHQVKKMMKSGIFEAPEWLQAMEMVPPTKIPKAKMPAALRFPETPLIKTYLRQHPQAKQIPVELDGPVPHIARRFAWRQLEVMQERNIGPKEAAVIVEEEFRKIEVAKEGGKPKNELSVVQQIQKEEQRELHSAMERIRNA
uniref:Small ribosomal subunit protein mS23 n=1 Tax=Tetraselmis chuii TaxID=63592 RepID=A0A7S1WYC9_9CHLO|mmetsp:Transcript_11124/g.20051  ORF Transcript_11124/g.20051 Transcript_11124/m.20051 type:complete len:154 (+) Transcript_11124:248-709(+)|eukprot:CAMPEP_0177767144 /NCGR_PEP_ID=MMETSP0491_2-20121128/8919_1 /TAXON_ID=63592 /ORGANISM="Tetraselmis chuii, Strain PLY429" /LENGTH=153 /DNA_ID=CAMNT_0019283641 /DNA_START=206 /DNA_END=667 /DNA_ORIENTATION=-